MKFVVALLLALAVQCYASRYQYSSEEREYNVEKQLEDLLQATNLERSVMWKSSVSAWPEASSYKAKVEQRINGSNSLSGKPELKRKLYKLADDKLEYCKKPNGQELDKQCLGRTTGQVMQLIAAVENVSRDTPNGSYRRY